MNRSRSNAVNHSFTGTDTATKIIPRDTAREYICLYAVSGDSQIRFGSEGVFADNNIKLPEGVMWEPKVTLTEEVWFLGDGSKLSVMY